MQDIFVSLKYPLAGLVGHENCGRRLPKNKQAMRGQEQSAPRLFSLKSKVKFIISPVSRRFYILSLDLQSALIKNLFFSFVCQIFYLMLLRTPWAAQQVEKYGSASLLSEEIGRQQIERLKFPYTHRMHTAGRRASYIHPPRHLCAIDNWKPWTQPFSAPARPLSLDFIKGSALNTDAVVYLAHSTPFLWKCTSGGYQTNTAIINSGGMAKEGAENCFSSRLPYVFQKRVFS